MDGISVDPFAVTGEVSLWRTHNAPVRWNGEALSDDAYAASVWDLPSTRAPSGAGRDSSKGNVAGYGC